MLTNSPRLALIKLFSTVKFGLINISLPNLIVQFSEGALVKDSSVSTLVSSMASTSASGSSLFSVLELNGVNSTSLLSFAQPKTRFTFSKKDGCLLYSSGATLMEYFAFAISNSKEYLSPCTPKLLDFSASL